MTYLDITLDQALRTLPRSWDRTAIGFAYLLTSHHPAISYVEYLDAEQRLRVHFETAEDRVQWQLTYL